MALTLDEVRRIATLARLRFTPEEEQTFSRQLGGIVDYIDQLAAYPIVDSGGAGSVEGIAPREAGDASGDCLPRESFLANAPAVSDGFLVVPEVKAEAESG